MFEFLKILGRDTRGATAVEYGLILALMFLAMVSALQSVGDQTIAMWTKVQNTMSAATGV